MKLWIKNRKNSIKTGKTRIKTGSLDTQLKNNHQNKTRDIND